MEIVPIHAERDRRIDEIFADIKELVEAGNVICLAFAIIERDHTISTGWSGDYAASLLGGVERLKYRINCHMDDN